ncbi:hypothetical protein GUITHDRAFT_100801 [Guillardia theta CCMP2712]|uniref:Membrane insertase YidC/Oxa/ALB C-terminal domain-containing protein n=1 Tax=Guillardia theta (strain CCMP2712) TaxID=905079 RepID=L1K080_GUITC|nr:hypothetical protein GUITHDRAFT_100801 [Guillardia theta CCMP2712]EKX53835.1 hypothetical protein GUITHDRAFT_100801 [Guillardia theta CCMP2712]|eukprot:XP_005840815.1 hypothetical protein GUITHDRAFT_100801 [Guillardia theta CCMP2712]
MAGSALGEGMRGLRRAAEAMQRALNSGSMQAKGLRLHGTRAGLVGLRHAENADFGTSTNQGHTLVDRSELITSGLLLCSVAGRYMSAALVAVPSGSEDAGLTAAFGISHWFGETSSYPNIVFAQEVLEHVHSSLDIPWSLTILGVTCCVRLAFFPLVVYQHRITGNLQAAAPKLQEIENEYKAAKEVYNDPGADSRRKMKLDEIYKAHGNCRPWKLFVNAFAQAPVFISIFFGIKDLGNFQPSFSTETFLWVSDLSTMDPYHILPVAAMASLLAVLETNLKARKATVNPMQFKMQLGVQRILCFSMVPMLIGLKYPAGDLDL